MGEQMIRLGFAAQHKDDRDVMSFVAKAATARWQNCEAVILPEEEQWTPQIAEFGSFRYSHAVLLVAPHYGKDKGEEVALACFLNALKIPVIILVTECGGYKILEESAEFLRASAIIVPTLDEAHELEGLLRQNKAECREVLFCGGLPESAECDASREIAAVLLHHVPQPQDVAYIGSSA